MQLDCSIGLASLAPLYKTLD